jgi:hypothetical protein
MQIACCSIDFNWNELLWSSCFIYFILLIYSKMKVKVQHACTCTLTEISYEKKVKTVMVNNSTDINKANNYLSHKAHWTQTNPRYNPMEIHTTSVASTGFMSLIFFVFSFVFFVFVLCLVLSWLSFVHGPLQFSLISY